MKSKVYITGGAGLFALNVAAYKKDDWDITLLSRSIRPSVDKVNVDLVNIESISEVRNYFKDKEIDFLIHAAGMTNVDECEKKVHQARTSNVTTSKKNI